jgi:hypothetical protein
MELQFVVLHCLLKKFAIVWGKTVEHSLADLCLEFLAEAVEFYYLFVWELFGCHAPHRYFATYVSEHFADYGYLV